MFVNMFVNLLLKLILVNKKQQLTTNLENVALLGLQEEEEPGLALVGGAGVYYDPPFRVQVVPAARDGHPVEKIFNLIAC